MDGPGQNIWTQVLDDADDATAQLILKLQLADIKEFASVTGETDRDFGIAASYYGTHLKQYRGARKLNDDDDDRSHSTGEGGGHDIGEGNSACAEVVMYECVSCGAQKTVDECWQVRCEHYYCDDCLERLFSDAIVDETLYPPRCCRQPMDFEDVQMLLTEQTRTSFERKREELDDKNRVYCHKSDCSTYIGVEHRTASTASCPNCGSKTCMFCKSGTHEGECPEDPELKQLLNLAQAEGWQRCPGCNSMVELGIGCNHMTCRCGAQFCYVCAGPWCPKTCDCPQWNQERLVERAQELERREGRRGAGGLQAQMRNLRERHECDHDYWNKVDGRHACEECHFVLPLYIFRCRQCRIQACWRCRQNRL